MMRRDQKEQVVEEIKAKFAKATAAFLTEYRGMTVESMTELRNKVRAGDGEVKVAKNRLVRIALKGTQFENLSEGLRGPVALAVAYADPVPVAKAIVDSMSDTSPLALKCGSLSGQTLDEGKVKELSKLPDRDTLLSMLLGALQAPAQNFASVLAAVPRDFVGVLSALKNEKEKQ